MEATRDEPVSPAGRLFMRPELYQVINCVIGLKHPPNIEAIKLELSQSVVVKHPRFFSLLVVDKHGREFWRKTQINLDDHIIFHDKKPTSNLSSDEEIEEKINSILADFSVSCPLSLEKPLWEIHVFSELKCMSTRLHHALGDGASLMSLVLATFRRSDGSANDGETRSVRRKERRLGEKGLLLVILKMIWFTMVAVIGLIGRMLCVKDKKTMFSGGEGVELWPRKVATAKFVLEDMKIVKKGIPNATINDVLFGVISYGFSKYMDKRSSHVFQEGLGLTGLSTVNLRKQPGLQELSKLMNDNSAGARWGNRFGYVLLPVYCYLKDKDPRHFVQRAKVMIDQKKQSLEAHFSYHLMNLVMSLFGPKVVSKLNYKILCNTSFMISNVVGPQEELTFAGNPITYIRPTFSSTPQAVTLIMVSYAGMADMQIQVAKDIIPDPEFLATCFEDSLLELRDVASNNLVP